MKTIFSLVRERKLQKLLFGLMWLNGSTRREFDMSGPTDDLKIIKVDPKSFVRLLKVCRLA